MGSRNRVASCFALLFSLVLVSITVSANAQAENTQGAGSKELLRAASSGNVSVVTELLTQGVDPDSHSTDRYARTALILAAAGGHTESARALLDKGAGLELRDNAGLTALNWAALRGHRPVAELLLARGADVTTRSKGDVTPLLYAVGTGNVALIDLFATNGADLDAQSLESSMTPLLLAIEGGDTRSVQRLVDLGADINKPNSDGLLPLNAASKTGKAVIIEILVDAGAR